MVVGDRRSGKTTYLLRDMLEILLEPQGNIYFCTLSHDLARDNYRTLMESIHRTQEENGRYIFYRPSERIKLGSWRTFGCDTRGMNFRALYFDEISHYGRWSTDIWLRELYEWPSARMGKIVVTCDASDLYQYGNTTMWTTVDLGPRARIQRPAVPEGWSGLE